MKSNYMSLALSMARKSVSRYRLGAVVVKGRKVVSTGYNQMSKTHPMMQRFNRDTEYLPRIHAEIHSCLGVPAGDLNGADVYVGRIFKNGNPALAKPCIICERFLRSVGVDKVYYSTDTGVGRLVL